MATGQQRNVLLALAAQNPGKERPTSLEIDQAAIFVCARCTAGAGPTCMVCREGKLPEAKERSPSKASSDEGIDMTEERERGPTPPDPHRPAGLVKSRPSRLLFRCTRCKQAAHYEHRERQKYTLHC